MPEPSESIGRLAPSAVQDSLIEQTIGFVWNCLIPWWSDPERASSEAEEDLNGDFHDFLSSRAVEDFPMVFFRHEQRQEGRRRVDLSAKPVRSVTIQGKTYSWNKAFLVIEGKRLPAPSKAREREYVSGGKKRSGGIQRFKLGLHGKDHETAIILGYLQQGTTQEWRSRINGWISDLAGSHPEEWGADESLGELACHGDDAKARTESVHPRRNECTTSTIRLLHFWIRMNAGS